MSRRRWGNAAAALTLLCTAALGVGTLPATAAPPPAKGIVVAADELALVRFELPGESMLHRLVAAGADVAAHGRDADGRVLADLVLDGRRFDQLVSTTSPSRWCCPRSRWR